MTSDDFYDLIRTTAAMLRGMTRDPSIPQHARNAMHDSANELDAALAILDPDE